jgi:alpha-glucoside transport system substrate-binding protein
MRYPTIGITLRIAGALVLIALVAAAGGGPGTASSSPAPARTVTVVASWTDQEQRDFEQVLQPFETRTGIKVNYTGTRALDQLLQSDIQQGNPPDLAILPSPGTLLSYQELGYLHPLDTVLSQREIAAYGPEWLNVMELGTSHLYTLPVKAALQNLLWYNPKQLPKDSVPGRTQPPSWSRLTALEHTITADGGTPWCLGLDSPPTSGWLGTDWIGDILLHQSGTAAYQAWADGSLRWTSPQVRAAWRAWGSLVAGSKQVHGGSTGALLTDWAGAGQPMFAKSPGCSLQYVPSFITVEYQRFSGQPQPGTGYDFFPSPMTGLPNSTPGASSDAWAVSADLLGMFNDTPDARLLVQYLASESAQRIWPGIKAGGATSADGQVPIGAYPDQVSAAIATIMTKRDQTLCFNASDLMPATMQNAFYQGVMEFLQNTSELTEILQRLEQIRQDVYQDFQPKFSCGT